MIEVKESNLLDSVRRVADARREAEAKLKADINAIHQSERIEDYVPAFCAFASSLLDAEAAEALRTFDEKEAYKRFLEQDLAIRIIEEILPDLGLASVKASWSPEVRKLSIENELDSEILLEGRPDGTTAAARAEIQAAHAQHGEWERFAPLTVRFRLRLVKQENALVRENLRQTLERRSFYWLGRFSIRPAMFGWQAAPPETVADAPVAARRNDMRQGFEGELSALLNEILSMHKPDGRVFEKIYARVSLPRIFIADIQLPIEAGDKLIRPLSNGLKDEFIVDDRVYRPASVGIPAYFEVTVRAVVLTTIRLGRQVKPSKKTDSVEAGSRG